MILHPWCLVTGNDNDDSNSSQLANRRRAGQKRRSTVASSSEEILVWSRLYHTKKQMKNETNGILLIASVLIGGYQVQVPPL
jgi:hypothetical protein